MADYLPYITGSGGALAVLAIGIWLIVTGKLHTRGEFDRVLEERGHYKDALETERITNNELARSGTVTSKVLDALVEVARDRNDRDRAEIEQHRRAARGAPVPHAEDTGP